MAERVFISSDYDRNSFPKKAVVRQQKNFDPPIVIQDWYIKRSSSTLREKATRHIRRSDVVVVVCGEYTSTAAGVATELSISQQEDFEYFPLNGNKNGHRTKSTTAELDDTIYGWTWPNLRPLISDVR